LPAGAIANSQGVASGLGVIPRIVADLAPIYPGPISLAEGKARLAALYDPYHRALQALLEKTRVRFGIAVLIDCHSMPSSRFFSARRRPDFILGDLKGDSCGHPFSDAAEAVLSSEGFSVVRNDPYAGGFITRTYGDPHGGFHALQIEINRSLYMNESSLKPNRGFLRLVGALEKLAHCLANTALQMHPPTQIAAE
jgi:N-formylglutamate amidohydrolase